MLQKEFSTRCHHLYFSGSCSAYLAERNDGLHVVGAQSFAQPTGIKSLIADQGQAIVPLAWQKHEADQIAERVDDHRDLRGQAGA
jgi:hypothetical protein